MKRSGDMALIVSASVFFSGLSVYGALVGDDFLWIVGLAFSVILSALLWGDR